MITNPAFLFIFIWVFLILMFSLGVLSLNVSYSVEALTIIGLNILLAVAMFIIFYKKSAVFNIFKMSRLIFSRREVVSGYWLWLFYAYMLISIFDVAYSGGVPLVWRLTGDVRQYVDFGIPTLHGIANAILFFLASFGVVLTHLRFKRVSLLLVLLFVWQIIILSRGTIMVMIVQMVLVKLSMARPSIRQAIYYVVFGVAVIVSFGILGDLRQGNNPYHGFVVEDWKVFFELMPSGFLWFYVYFVSGFNNLLFNAPLIEPNYFPIFTFAKLLPSVAYSIIGIEKAVDSFQFVNAGLNVSTIYSGFYSDFGLFAFIPVFFIQFIASYSYSRAVSGNLLHLLSFSVSCQAIVFSPFIDTFFYLPFIFQFVFIIFLKKIIYR